MRFRKPVPWRWSIKRLIITSLVWIACALQLWAQAPASLPSSTELSIRVVLASGRPAGPNIKVEVLGAYGGSVATAPTDTSGNVIFRRMDPGKYKLRVSGPGIATTDGPDIDLRDAGPRVNFTVQVKQEGEAAPTVDPNVPKEARKEFEKADDKMQSQDWSSAQPHLEKAIAIYPKYAMAYNNLGIVLLHLKQGEKAIENFRKAVELDEKLPQANLYLGQFYYENKQFGDAEKYLQRASNGDPTNAQILLALANCQFRNGENDQALSTAQKVHALPDHKKYAMAHVIAAQVYADKGDKQHALSEYQLFLKEDPGSPIAGQVKEAQAKLETAAK